MDRIQPMQTNPIEIVEEVKKHKKPIFQFKHHNGLKVYELDLKTGEIFEAEFEEGAIKFETFNGINIDPGLVKKVITKENCIYVQAINVKNAKRKFTKMIYG